MVGRGEVEAIPQTDVDEEECGRGMEKEAIREVVLVSSVQVIFGSQVEGWYLQFAVASSFSGGAKRKGRPRSPVGRATASVLVGVDALG